MIKLQVADYCQNCPEFEPRVTKDERVYEDYSLIEMDIVKHIECNTTITCEHAARCQTIRDYIQREVNKKK